MEAFAREFLLSLKSHQTYVCFFVFLVSFSESFAFVGLVVPGAVFALSAGFLAYKGYFELTPLIVAGSAGAILADIASYYLGKYYADALKSSHIYKRYRDRFAFGEAFFQKHGGKSVFIGRFVGALRPVIPFLAGMLGMKSAAFYFWAITSGILWGICYIGAGYIFAGSLGLFEEWLGRINYAAGALLLLIAAVYFFRKRYRE